MEEKPKAPQLRKHLLQEVSPHEALPKPTADFMALFGPSGAEMLFPGTVEIAPSSSAKAKIMDGRLECTTSSGRVLAPNVFDLSFSDKTVLVLGERFSAEMTGRLHGLNQTGEILFPILTSIQVQERQSVESNVDSMYLHFQGGVILQVAFNKGDATIKLSQKVPQAGQ